MWVENASIRMATSHVIRPGFTQVLRAPNVLKRRASRTRVAVNDTSRSTVHRIFQRATSAREHLSARAMASTTAARARVSHAHDPRTSRLGARAHVPRGLAARTPARNATSLPRRVSPRASSDDSPASDVDAPGASPSGVPEALSRRLRAEAAQRTAQRTARVAAGVARAGAPRRPG